MKPFTKYLFLYIIAFSALTVVCLESSHSVAAQEKAASNSNSKQTEKTPTPTPIPTPIPISEVVTQGEVTTTRLNAIKQNLGKKPDITVIESELPILKDQLDTRVTETTNLLNNARPSLETLRTVEQDWQALAKNIPAWKADLKTRIDVFDKHVNELQNLMKIWQMTLDSLTSLDNQTQGNSNLQTNTINQTNTNTKNPVKAGEVPVEILEKIRTEITEIENLQNLIEDKRGKILTLQSRVFKEEVRINETLATIKQARENALTKLFVRDSPPIWNARSSADSIAQIFSGAKDSYTLQINTLSDYAKANIEKFVLQGLIFVLFAGILIRARKRLRPLVEKEPELQPAYSAFELPLVGALILAILLSGWLYPQAPRMLSAIIGAAALVPGIIYLRRILEKPLFPVLNALMVFYFVDQLRQITATQPLLSRILFTAEMLAVIIFLIWFLRSKRLSGKIEVKHQRIFVVIKKAIPYLLALFIIALISNLLGFVSLSNILGNGILGSSYISLILYTAIQIIKSLIIFAFRVNPLAKLGMVKNHDQLLKKKIFRILKWLGIVLWAILTLNLFSVRQTLFGFFKQWIFAELSIGSISISLSDIIIFGFTVWLAFTISKFIRFILEEDVYNRVDLAGGVPYAISTVLHYVILVGGFIFAIAALGIDLTKFTILISAFGVGLGFGLQNIVNNFVSGLILLFERPVKVNDVVQIGTHQGDLKRIGLRASILRTLDGAEVIVPNGQLISEEVTNWTFSDQQRRLEINVGVAYGSDPRQIIDLLTDIAIENEEVLDEPAARTIFVGFGDNALNFQLRAWTDSTSWVVVKSDLSLAIHDALQKADIEIPFPQRDLHVRDVDSELLKKLDKQIK